MIYPPLNFLSQGLRFLINVDPFFPTIAPKSTSAYPKKSSSSPLSSSHTLNINGYFYSKKYSTLK